MTWRVIKVWEVITIIIIIKPIIEEVIIELLKPWFQKVILKILNF